MSDIPILPEFSQNPQSAVDKYSKFFQTGEIKQRLDELNSNPNYRKHHACQQKWIDKTLVVCCKTCKVGGQCLICIPCFLNGNHKGHDYYIGSFAASYCSCGHSNKMNPSGFCSQHCEPKKDPNIEDLGESVSELVIDIFEKAFDSFSFLATFDPPGLKIVSDFVISIASQSDALLRCLAIAITERCKLDQFMINAAAFYPESFVTIINFFSHFFTDDFFSYYFTFNFNYCVFSFARIMTEHEIKIISNVALPPHRHILDFLLLNSAFFRPESNKFLVEKQYPVESEISSMVTHFIFALDAKWDYSYGRMTFFNKFFAHYADLIPGLPEDIGLEVFERLFPLFTEMECTHFFGREFEKKQDDPSKKQALSVDVRDAVLPIYLAAAHFLKKKNEFYMKWYEKTLKVLEYSNHIPTLPVEYQSTLEDNVPITSMLLFINVASSLVLNESIPSKALNDILNSLTISKDDFMKITMIFPLRWLITVSQSFFGMFVRNDDSMLASAQKFLFKSSITNRFLPMFSMIQLYAGLYSNKNEFLQIITSIYGLFYNFEDKNQESENLFSMIYFIACLIVDRIIIKKNFPELRKYLLISILQEKPLTLIHIQKKLWDDVTNTPTFMSELESIATHVPGEEYSSYKLNSDVEWFCIQPWAKQSDILKQIGNFMQKHGDLSLIPFPEWEDEPELLNLRDFLVTKFIYGLEYRILNDYVFGEASNKASVQIVLNLILLTHKLFGSESEGTQFQEIKAPSMRELIALVPDKFGNFIRTPISYEDRNHSSVVDLLKTIGSFTNLVLEKLGIETFQTEVIETSNEKLKAKAKRLKQSIINEFKIQQNLFNSFDVDTTEIEECAVCQMASESEVLCYPSLVHSTGIPNFLQNGKFKQTVFINICMHLVHSSCVVQELNDNLYRCPIDRSVYNFFMPNISIGCSIPTSDFQMESAIIKRNFSKFTTSFHPATVLAGHLVIAEMRFRYWPSTLDKPVFATFMNCFFVNSWHFLRLHQDQLTIKEINDIPLEKLIYDLMKSETPKDKFLSLVHKYIDTFDDKSLLIYLRHIALLQHFCLELELSPKNQIIDWETILSFESLCQRYKIQHHAEIELPLFQLVKLPNNFLELAMSPYSINLTESRSLIALCLLTNKVVSISKQNVELGFEYETLHNHLTKLGGTTILLLLNGPFASAIAVTSLQFSFVVKIISPYINKYGDEDPGYVTGQELRLSQNRLERAFDIYLSGEWTQYIPKQV